MFLAQATEKSLLETSQEIGMHILFYASIFIMVLIVLASLRFIMRFMYHWVRKKYLGGMVWNEVVYEGSVNQEELVNSVGQMDNMQHIMFGTTGSIFGFINWRRPMVSLMIRKDSEDDSVHMYIGMDKKHYKSDYLSYWAQGSNCSVEEVSFDSIGFIPKAPITAIVENYNPSRFTNSPTNSTVGGTVSRIQSSTKNGESGTVLITFEPMVKKEQNLLEDHINTENERGSSSNAYTKVRDQAQLFTDYTPSRGVIIGFSDSGDERVSTSMVRAAVASMANLGVNADIRRYENLMKQVGIISIFPAIILGTLSFFAFIPWWISITTISFTLITLIGLPFLSSYWICKASQDGSAPIPPFRQWAPRRFFQQWLYGIKPSSSRRNKTVMPDGNVIDHKDNFVARPSTAEIMPFYQTSLMQFASMPNNGTGSTNISKSVIPQIALPASTNKEIRKYIESGDVFFEGTSARSHEPVFMTLKDTNFGCAYGGDAGSGKTNSLMIRYLNFSFLSRKTTGAMAKVHNGNKITINPIWFESKSDDFDKLVNYVKEYDPAVFKLHDPRQKSRLTLEGRRYGDEGVTIEDIIANKNVLLNAMEAIWGESFGPQSKRVADNALSIAYLIDQEGLDALEFTSRLDNPDRPNIMHLVYLLINGDASLTVKEALEKYAKSKRAIMTDSTQLAEYKAKHGIEKVKWLKALVVSLDGLINLYSIPNAIGPLQNKIPQLLKSKGLWDTQTHSGEDRHEFSIDKLFTYGGPVLVDMTPKNSELAPDDTKYFIMMVHYILWQRLRMVAGGWASKGRFTPIFVDEITNFTGRAADQSSCATIIGEVRDQGRSYGVSHNVGFQNFSQLPPDTKESVLSFESKIFFKFGNNKDQVQVMEQLNSHRFSEANIRSFPIGVGIAQLSINRIPRTEFTIKAPAAEAWREALSINQDMDMAFEAIKDTEVAVMKREKKKNVDDTSSNDDNYEEYDEINEDNFDDLLGGLVDDGSNSLQDDDRPPLSWS